MISLIATVFNEGENIHNLMQSLVAQTRQADEVVIVDGGSRDETVVIMDSYREKLPLKIFVQEGCNISEGRNRAIAEATGEIMAITDAGVRLSENWLENITQPFNEHPNLDVVAGFFRADANTPFEIAMGATVLPLVDEIDIRTFLPSSRSIAVRKSAIEKIGGYPEWLDYCEDLIFDLRLKDTAQPFVFAPQAVVYFRPRSSWKTYFKQYYLYARGDGKADLWRKRHAIRYVTYLLGLPIIFLLGWLLHPLFWALYLFGGIVYLWQPYQRLPQVLQFSPAQSFLGVLQIIILIPFIRVVGDIAKMIGYPVGWVWRLKHQPPEWKIK